MGASGRYCLGCGGVWSVLGLGDVVGWFCRAVFVFVGFGLCIFFFGCHIRRLLVCSGLLWLVALVVLVCVGLSDRGSRMVVLSIVLFWWVVGWFLFALVLMVW